MCLVIDSKYHPRGGHTPAFVADRPIVVYKRLINVDSNSGVSPYQHVRWHFGKVMTVPNFSYDCWSDRWDVEQGLHAFFKKDAPRARNPQYTLYPAVIPVGARFYLGQDGEIVSTALTVYLNEAELLAAHGAAAMGEPVPRSSLKRSKTRTLAKTTIFV